MSGGEEKYCTVCGRRIEWRRKWARDWENVRYCSAACRRRGLGDDDRRLEALILEMLSARSRGATLCPSEVARRLDADEWRVHMEAARSAARRLVVQGRIEVTQKGRVVDPSTARGPIRLRLTR